MIYSDAKERKRERETCGLLKKTTKKNCQLHLRVASRQWGRKRRDSCLQMHPSVCSSPRMGIKRQIRAVAVAVSVRMGGGADGEGRKNAFCRMRFHQGISINNQSSNLGLAGFKCLCYACTLTLCSDMEKHSQVSQWYWETCMWSDDQHTCHWCSEITVAINQDRVHHWRPKQ